ncbi:hypothetical protein SDRG_00351 [Saprolegnia diclina VS20]|uniref:VLRF1 domain-containing protein n=1 Tax=Saprolegnia diclina (strain VS20) TaxID=1156394 RepID=T0SIB7_SAPDV|nr:hypothetical protein SDRG_00351 [Saprolegnia diclina VS20]EQC42622.1 hypothetical protein SDRG_00351 [Saprolegnia diclina VS20]|eukprot:XP_008604045.1 hypothetical protein SDRG_00351 [Saprolegnia diclina VS20]
MERKQRYGSIPLWELSNLGTWRSLNGAVDADPAPATTTTAEPPVVRAHLDVRGLTCGTCRLEFEDVKEQQAHFKTDLHVYNLKRKSKGLDCVTLAAYDAFVASQATTSTTPLAADSDEDEAQDVYRHPLDLSISSDENDSDDEGSDANLQREPLQAFTDNTTLFKIYNASFPQWSEKDKATFQASTDMVQCFSTDPTYYQWAVFLFRAGRFAGAVFQKDKVLVHKAFQRYTTRRKQGGSQSAHDAAGGKAKSAGAQLRRYNEMALQQDISELLTLWKTELQGCKRIFLGSAKTSRGLFFEKTGLQADDPRIRKVPFGTLRPTYDEVCRVRSVLGSASYGPFVASVYEPKPMAAKTPKQKKAVMRSVDAASRTMECSSHVRMAVCGLTPTTVARARAREQQPATIALWDLRRLEWQPLGKIDAPADAKLSPGAIVEPSVRGRACAACGLVFDDVAAQQAHFKTAWHTANVRRRARGRASVTGTSFEANGEASDDSDGSDDNDAVVRRCPTTTFTNGSSHVTMYNTVFSAYDRKDKTPFLATPSMLMGMRYHWAVLLFRAGRFAGAVFQCDALVVSKTLQRYTVRRKQGGSQSAHGGCASTQGAILRLYNERRLQEEISTRLCDWKRDLDACERIFLGCAKRNRKVFFNKTGLTPRTYTVMVAWDLMRMT